MKLLRWDADYDYLRADYFADYCQEDYEDEKEVIVRESFKKQAKKNFTLFRNKLLIRKNLDFKLL